jgi:hypothetical protein
MSAVKKIGIVVVISSIIGFAYYFLIKSKPKVLEKQLEELNTEKVSVVDEQLTTPLSVEEQLKIDKCSGLGRSEYNRCMGIIPEGTGTRGNISTTTSQTPTAVTILTGATTTQTPTAGTTSAVASNDRPPRGTSTSPIRVQQSGARG